MSGYADHFSVVDDAIGPQPWMQMREVAAASSPSVAKSYDPGDGVAKNDPLQTITLDWTNTRPVHQLVYGLVTRGGQQVTLQTRSRGYIADYHGGLVGAGGIDMVLASRFGTGGDVGKGGILATSSAFSIAEVRGNSQSMYLLPASVGQWDVAPGATIHAKFESRFVSEFWENGNIDGGDTGTESKIISGETLLQFIATPTLTPPPPRSIPTIVGGAGNIKHDIQLNVILGGTETNPLTPTGLAVGDTLLAIVCSQFGINTDIYPLDAGWTMIHDRNEGLFGFGDVHMRIFLRTVVNPGTEPADYSFANHFPGSESVAVLIPLRGASPVDDGGGGSNWYVASNLSRYQLVEEQVAPSLDRQGQLLLAVSYFNHSPTQATISQAPPVGMTELVDIPGTASTIAIAFLPSPPTPTFDRRFTPTEIPIFFGHSIAAAILIPGAQEV